MSAREDSDLARAIAENDLPAIVRRVRAGPLPAAVTGDGQTCVMLAARFDRPALLRGFLARGVPVDARTRSGMTALMLAAGKGSSPCVRILLHAGADPSLGNDRGLTALDIARENRRGEVAELLETWSPPPSAGTWGGTTPGMDAQMLIESARRAADAGDRATLTRRALDFAALLDVDARWALATRLRLSGQTEHARALLEDVLGELRSLGREDDAVQVLLHRAEVGADPDEEPAPVTQHPHPRYP